MAYTSRNPDLFITAANADWYAVRNVRALHKNLSKVAFSVVAQRTAAIEAINSFRGTAVVGFDMFANDTRFPDAPAAFLSDMDPALETLLLAITSSLSWRETNSAKDTETHLAAQAPGRPAPTNDQRGFLGQSYQDASNAYYKNLAALSALCADGYSRGSFEARLSLTWA